ncbi:hypothetical protein V6N12_068493 [Hibiscus sabdariffa]|uniref:Reverse transcriptase/retrotransposon-derived protein RNase H-like domain-containing protein n=1 Tax=Hibiscus sabdariffa TaxID=183260 RepID=A0ABR2FQ56_9ROSI
MVSELMLVLPDYTKSFEVYADASDVAIGWVLMQEGHPVTFENQKLNETENNYQRLKPKVQHESVSLPMGDLVERIREELSHDLTGKTLIDLAKEGKTQRFWLDGDLLYYRDIEAYVKTCLVCQQDKIEMKKPAGLLQPLPIPERPWESVSMDFIVGLPSTNDLSSIMVAVDRFSKYMTFIPTAKVCLAEEVARDTQFTGRFWTELFKLMGSCLIFSMSVHLQIYWQTERVNALVDIYLRHYVSATQRNWPKLLDVA